MVAPRDVTTCDERATIDCDAFCARDVHGWLGGVRLNQSKPEVVTIARDAGFRARAISSPNMFFC